MLGKYLPLALVAVTLILNATGCNFFGKLEDAAVPTAIGELGDGSSFVGSWTISSASTSAEGEPTYAVTETYTFDPNGSARIELRDVLSEGITCTGYGQFRQTGSAEVTVYLQSVEPANCAFSAQLKFSDVRVSGSTFKFKDPLSGYEFSLLKARTPSTFAPIGVWDFNSAGADESGEGGIDYIFFDPRGYFLLQTTSDGEQFLLIGYYTISNGSLSLSFFSGMDPAQVSGSPLVYKQFVTDGSSLQLVEETEQGDFVYTGSRL